MLIKKGMLFVFLGIVLSSLVFAACCPDCGYQTVARHYSDSGCTLLSSQYTVCWGSKLASYPGICTVGSPYDKHYYTGVRCDLGDCTPYTLTVSNLGNGTVTSLPAGINCGSTCSSTYISGTSVTLTATPISGYNFSSWSGNCSGTGTCSLIMNQHRSVTATFADLTAPILYASNNSSEWFDYPINSTIFASDNGSGLAEIRYNWGTNDMNESCTSGGTITTNGTSLRAPSGNTTIYLCARDGANNVATWNGTYNWDYDENSYLQVDMDLNTTSVIQNNLILVDVNVTCKNGTCSDVVIALDPFEVNSFNYSFLVLILTSGILGGFLYKRKKSQTSTEYMIIVAVVIVIAIVVSNILGDFPSLGQSTARHIDDLYLKNTQVAVDNYACNIVNSSYLLRNNYYKKMLVTSVTVNSINCTSDFPITLNIGQSRILTCTGLSCDYLGETDYFKNTPKIVIGWKDVETGSSYSTSPNTSTTNLPSNKLILGNISETPFYIIGNANYTCGVLIEDESCQYSFSVNATGLGDYYFFALATGNEKEFESAKQVISIG